MLRGDNSYYIAVVHASYRTNLTRTERRIVSFGIKIHLEKKGMKIEYKFPYTPRGKKQADQKAEQLKKAIKDFADKKYMVVESTEGFYF